MRVHVTENDKAVSNVRRSTAFALMAALMLSIGAQCLAAQEMTSSQMACCADSVVDCDRAAVLQDCCESERAEQAQLLIPFHQVVQPVAVLTSATAALLRPPVARSRIDIASAPVNASSRPKHVLLATFLI